MLTREDFHDLKNQIAIALGMTDLTLRSLKKDPSKIDTQKIIDRSEKSIKALEKILALVDKGHQAIKKEATPSASATSTEGKIKDTGHSENKRSDK